jgi:hypothetical protein
MPKLIGLMGYAGAGKNAIADALGYPQYAFANALKADLDWVLTKLGLDIRKPEDKAKARELLVAYGRLARAVEPSYWIRRLHEYRLTQPNEDAVITDVRYLNEVLYILNHGGRAFFINRPGVGPANDEEKQSFDDIFQAWFDDEINFKTVVNDGTVEQAANRVREAAVLAHPTMRKMQEYPDNYPAEKIEEKPHFIDHGDCQVHSDAEFEAIAESQSSANLIKANREHQARVQIKALSVKDEYIRQQIEAQATEFDRCFKDPDCTEAPPGYYFERLPLGEKGKGGVMTRVFRFAKWLMD